MSHTETVFAGTWPFCAQPLQEAARACSPSSSICDLVVDAIEKVELNPRQPTVGAPGSLPNRDGVYELDAAIMSADSVGCGAVLGLRGFAGAMRAAKLVATSSPHSILVGQGAQKFAEAHASSASEDGCGQLAHLVLTDEIEAAGVEMLERHKAEQGKQQHHSDTLGVIGCRRRVSAPAVEAKAGTQVEIVCAVASSGLGGKEPGRVGDSALFGSGLYCDKNAGACVATGDGDVIAVFPLSFLVCQMLAASDPAKDCVDDICDRALDIFLTSPNVRKFVRQSAVKNRLSAGGPMVAICAVRASDGQVGGSCNASWRKDFVLSSVQFDHEQMVEERKVSLKRFV